MAETLNLRPPELIIQLDKGKSFCPIFFYLAEDLTVIDITGFTARMQVRLGGVLQPGWDLTTENGGLTLVTGSAAVNGVEIANAQGIQLNVDDSVTETSAFITADFDIELINLAGKVLPFLRGSIELSEEVTK